MKIPITIITGYLGAGKTTLLRNILDNAREKIAVIMNEFGEINIDGKILKGKDVNMVELQGGCVCCSLTGEFEAAVKEIIEKAKPDAIVMETTGVAEPDAVIIDIQDNLPELRLDAVITIADADAIIKFPTIGHTGKMQIEMADIILLNKADLVKKEQLKEVEDKLKKINNKAILLKTIKGNIRNDYLFGINAKKLVEKRSLHNVKESYFYFKTEKIIDMEKFENFAKNLPKSVYRAKGFIKSNKGDFLFNYVAGRRDFEVFKTDNTELVFIGESADKDKKRILDMLAEVEM